MAVGFSIGRNSWNGIIDLVGKSTQAGVYSTDISSGETNVCLSLHFGPSAPTWKSITSSSKSDIHYVRPYEPGMIVPFFIFEIGPYFWDWSAKSDFYNEEQSGTDIFIRGTLPDFIR